MAKLESNGIDDYQILIQKAYTNVVKLISCPTQKCIESSTSNHPEIKRQRVKNQNNKYHYSKQSGDDNESLSSEPTDLQNKKTFELVTRDKIIVSLAEKKSRRPKPNAETFHSSCSGNKISDENIGFQMMQKIGWTGGALGAKSDGIEEPVGYKFNLFHLLSLQFLIINFICARTE